MNTERGGAACPHDDTIRGASISSARRSTVGQPRIGHRRRKILWQQQRGICALRGRPMRKGDAAVDHILPRSRGGADRRTNLQLAHGACNQAKGN